MPLFPTFEPLNILLSNNMKKFTTILMVLCLAFGAFAQNKQAAGLSHDAKMEWWREAKFGLFVHWGPYCLYGGVYNGFNQHRGGAEWIMNRCKISVREYRAKASTFNPVQFNADAMVLAAKNAGMKYVVFTTKHHDGFAMFKSNASEFNIVDYTPFKRDIVDEVAQACRKHGLKIGFYYSQSQDWCNAGGATARKEMWEGWANPDSAAINEFTRQNTGAWDCLQRTATFDNYLHRVAIPQIKELLSRYGDMAVLWFDTPMSITDQQAGEITKLLADYPQIITNDRLKRPNFGGDYKTPEGRVPKAEDIVGVDWETCMNIGSSWGYKSWEASWKSSEELIRNLATIAARGGNYLLNIGPDPLGNVPQTALNRLQDMGNWMKVNGEAIYGSQRSLMLPSWGECIRKDGKKSTTLYLCVFDWPKEGKLVFDKEGKVKGIKKITLLADGSSLKYAQTKDGKVLIDVPAVAPDKIATVIKVELTEKWAPIKLIANSEKVFKILDE